MILIAYFQLYGIMLKVRLFTMATKIEDGNLKRYGRILFAFKVERSCRTFPDEIGELVQLRSYQAMSLLTLLWAVRVLDVLVKNIVSANVVNENKRVRYHHACSSHDYRKPKISKLPTNKEAACPLSHVFTSLHSLHRYIYLYEVKPNAKVTKPYQQTSLIISFN